MEVKCKLIVLAVCIIFLGVLTAFRKAKTENSTMAWHQHNAFKVWTGTRFANTPEGVQKATEELKNHLRNCTIEGTSGICNGDSPF